jgi:hypothetical protein
MPVPDFSPGEVLTAAAMDSIGLWKIASGTLSTATTDFVGCFTSDYTNYRIIIDGLSFSATGTLHYRMLSGTTPATGATDYQHSYTGLTVGGAASNANNAGTDIGNFGTLNIGANNLPICSVAADILNPQTALRTLVISSTVLHPSALANRNGMSYHNVAASYDGIRISTFTATTVSGNVTIYGYRK